MKKVFESMRQDVGYMRACERRGSVISWVIALCSHLAYSFSAAICKVRGHKWIDESHAGPDSGCMAGRCTRCGFSYHKILY